MLPPGSKLTLVADASVEPVTVAEAKLFARVFGDSEDSLIGTFITSARKSCEEMSGRSFITQQWRLSFDHASYRDWGYRGNLGLYGYRDCSLVLPRPALISVDSIASVSPDGTSTPLDTGSYRVSTGTPGRIYPVHNSSFPFLGGSSGYYEVLYTAGYGPTADDVPSNVKNAILILTAYFYQNRSSDAPIPQAVSALLDRERLGTYG